MPLPKGAKKDPKTGKFKLPPGHKKKHSNDGKAPKREPVSLAQRIERNHQLVGQTARQGFIYALFASYPTGRSYLAEIEEPTFESIGRKFGGGRYEVWKKDRTTGEAVGDPVVYDVDKVMFPVALPGFLDRALQLPGNQMQAPWLGLQNQGFQPMPPPGFGPPAGGQAAKLEELQDDLDEAEDEIDRLKSSLAEERRGRESDRIANERTLADMARKEEFRTMLDALKGDKKDPLEMLINFKRAETELAGPMIKSGNPLETMQGSMAMINMMLELSKKLNPGGGDSGNGLSTFMELATAFMKAKAEAPEQVIALPAGPVVKTPTPEELAKAEQEKKNEALAQAAVLRAGEVIGMVAREMLERLKSGETIPAHEELARFILDTKGQDFEVFRAVVKVDNPENALQLFAGLPDLIDTDEKKKWIVAAFAHAQAQLVG